MYVVIKWLLAMLIWIIFFFWIIKTCQMIGNTLYKVRHLQRPNEKAFMRSLLGPLHPTNVIFLQTKVYNTSRPLFHARLLLGSGRVVSFEIVLKVFQCSYIFHFSLRQDTERHVAVFLCLSSEPKRFVFYFLFGKS